MATSTNHGGALELLREATRGTAYEGRLFLVGGWVRDRLLGRPGAGDDLDLVLEGDALAVARLLYARGVADHSPVEYGQFGTTQVSVAGAKVEIVTARAETYRQGSRKPIVTPGTLQTDAERRDFTINTLLENLHAPGDVLDPTGRGRSDLAAGILRTPTDPRVTFSEDPLRMLRACRFAAKLGFVVEDETRRALFDCAALCVPENGVSFERIREELTKTLLVPGAGAPRGLEMMRETGLLDGFAPELSALHGVEQNRVHAFDVWTHTLRVVENLPADATLELRLAALFHDIGKPETRTWDSARGGSGDYRFSGHAEIGARITTTLMTRLRFPNDTIKTVTRLVELHMRYGDYDARTWTDRSIRKLLRDVGDLRHDLFTLTRADAAAVDPAVPPWADFAGLMERMERIEGEAHVTSAQSPLDGAAICVLLGITPGPLVGRVKAALTEAVALGDLAEGDVDGAKRLAHTIVLRERAIA